MARPSTVMTRSPSTSSSGLSNINVAGTAEDENASERVAASTPPTSIGDAGSIGSAKANTKQMDTVAEEPVSGRRPRRAKANVNYNLQALSEAQIGEAATATSSRNVSGLTGRTLIESIAEEFDRRDAEHHNGTGIFTFDLDALTNELEEDTRKNIEMMNRLPPVGRRPSVKDRIKNAAGKVSSALGKRGRGMMEAGKRKVDELSGSKEKQSRWLKELDTGSKGFLDEFDLDTLQYGPPSKKQKREPKAPVAPAVKPAVSISAASNVATNRKGKRWEREGLYVGQEADSAQPGTRNKLQKKRPSSSMSNASEDAATQPPAKRSFLSLPMFDYLENHSRDFTIPFEVFATSAQREEKPKDWHQLNRNRLVGEAKGLWEKEDKLARSLCVCQPPGPGEQGCRDGCLNRIMHYECDEDNCNLPASDCSNRPFTELAARTKKGGKYDIGVEVIKTQNRGHGVKSCRTFAPGQIVMEYTGEIISEAECQRRMRELYNGRQCYYLMEFDQGLVIDGTKGSMARFINHSCAPNCEVRMVNVNGTPRMGVFAGDDGVMTGEELTYDYNFDNFGETKQICYCGAASCRGTLSKRLNAAEQKKRDREENEKKRKAEEEAQSHAQDLEKKKRAKNERGPGWTGWVPVQEVVEDLKRQKAEKEEREKTSDRARRLAARRQSAPVERNSEPEVKAPTSRRRRSVVIEQETKTTVEDVEAVLDHVRTSSTSTIKRSQAREAVKRPVSPSHGRTFSTTSTSSKFVEDLPLERSETAQSSGSKKRKEAEKDPQPTPPPKRRLLETGAKKGKDVLKAVGQTLKKKTLEAGAGAAASGGKLRQSTLQFAKALS